MVIVVSEIKHSPVKIQFSMLKAHLKTLTLYGCASSKQQGGGGALRNELDDEVM